MNITASQLENVTEIATVSAVASYGTGLLTAIVTSFIELFGCNNEMLAEKVAKARNAAIDEISKNARRLNADGIMNFKIEMSGKTVLVYGTAYASGNSQNSDALPELLNKDELDDNHNMKLYQRAVLCLQNEEYDTAKSIFSRLKDYNDSKQQLEKISDIEERKSDKARKRKKRIALAIFISDKARKLKKWIALAILIYILCGCILSVIFVSLG